jgi:hypothetical protein
MNTTAVILLAWKRPLGTLKLLKDLFKQTRGDFDIYVSNSDPKNIQLLKTYAEFLGSPRLHIFYNDSNKYYSFRRLFIAEKLAKIGYKKIFLLDDDVRIKKNYIETALNQYQEKTYFSWYAWKYTKNLSGYGHEYFKDRMRVSEVESLVDYAGPGISMIDSSLFLEKEIFNVLEEDCYIAEDIWISYVCGHLLSDWKMKYMDVPVSLHAGGDSHALYVTTKAKKINVFRKLTSLGWLNS